MPAFDLRQGDSLAILPTLPAASLDACVTDPPYELGFMGQAWDRTGIANNVELWRGVLRALKPGAHLVAFGGTRTYHRMACAIEDAGFEIRDQIGWLYGSGFPKSANLDGDWAGWGTALKPAWEPIVLARRPLAQKTVAANVTTHGTGALHIDAARIPADGAYHENVGGIGYVTAEGGGVYGEGSTLNGQKSPPSALGRWPANVIHDGSPEVLAAFAAFGERISGSAGQIIGKHGFDGFNGGGTGAVTYGVADSGRGSAARFYYCAKASPEDRDAGLEHMRLVHTRRYGEQGQGRTAQQTPRTAVAQANHHPTVKPTELMRHLVRLVTPAGGTVLDPFTGSGSTGRGAVLEGFNFVGIEQDAAYVEIARARITEALGPLFAGLT